MAAQSYGGHVLGERFSIVGRLGAGGMGAVYEAIDRFRNARVAIKSLGVIEAKAVHAFKAEFRDFQHLHHPNVIALDELFCVGKEWYFTMELVRGRDFLSVVRRSVRTATSAPTETSLAGNLAVLTPTKGAMRLYPGALDEGALRACLRQLAAAIAHLHDAGKVHRDVKSSNVLVTDDGRTVLLDFGVAVSGRSHSIAIAGTPLYMAPELFEGRASPSADWYAVGILLYQALSGCDPWQGDFGSLARAKEELPAHPTSLDASAPVDLGDLCLLLLSPRVEARAGRLEIEEFFDVSSEPSSGVRRIPPHEEPHEFFVGRRAEQNKLRAAFDETLASAAPRVAYVHGESGIGKTALVDEFVAGLVRRHEATLLRGRVLEEERVPYKSVDGIIDSLCALFLEMPSEEVLSLLPAYFDIVADVFPVLRQVRSVAELPRSEMVDPLVREGFMAEALKDCLRRLAERRPLIVFVDDFHASDEDSVRLWNNLMREPFAPRMLLVGTMRADATASLRASALPRSFLPSRPDGALVDEPPFPRATTEIWLSRFSEAESQAYFEARVSTGSLEGRDHPSAEGILQEAAGHPLFIDELVRYRGDGVGSGDLTLEAVLAQRIAGLDPDQRRYLSLVCAASRPLSRGTYSKAAGLGHGDGLRALKALRSGRLVRTGRVPGSDGDDWVSPFHYRVRNACLEGQTEDDIALIHHALATTLEAEGRFDSAQLATEWRSARQWKKAALYTEIAAKSAFEAFAFQRAAELYGDALSLIDQPPEKERVLREAMAKSLRSGGKSEAAARVLAELASEVGAPQASELRREAAELFLRSGHVTQGRAMLERVLRDVGFRLPKDSHAALVRRTWLRARLRARGLGSTPRSERACDPAELRLLDALWCAECGLAELDPVSADVCGTEFALRALDCGEPMRVARALAAEELRRSARGGSRDSCESGDGGIDPWEWAAMAPEVRRADLGFVIAAPCLVLMQRGEWPACLRASRTAQDRILAECQGASGDLAMASEAEVSALSAMGSYGELRARAQWSLSQAKENNDASGVVAAACGLASMALLAADEGRKALDLSVSALGQWTRRDGARRLQAVYARAQSLLYLGDVQGAGAALDEVPQGSWWNPSLAPDIVRGHLLELRARVGLAQFCANRANPDRAAIHGVHRDARSLRRRIRPWARGLGEIIECQALRLEGQWAEAAEVARDAAGSFRLCGMGHHAELADGLAASEGQGEVDWEGLVDQTKQRGVDRPAALVALMVPEFRLRSR